MSAEKKQLVRRSKHLSLVLRHDPGSVGLTLDAAGWVDVSFLLAAMHFTSEQLDEVVSSNGKQRFEFNADRTRIRASQGHSVDVDLGYDAKPPPDTLYHGTGRDSLDSILTTGIDKRQRHHVHLSADRDIARVVARRRPKPVLLEVAAARMAVDGHAFYLSTNGVWLTDHVPHAYLTVLAEP